MTIDTALLRGRHVYLELLQPVHREPLRQMARDERIWEFTKTLLPGEVFDKMFDAYFDTALDTGAMGGQQAFVIRQVAGDAMIGMTRFYGIIAADKRLEIGYTWYIPAVWGGVHNKECKLLLLGHAFEALDCMQADPGIDILIIGIPGAPDVIADALYRTVCTDIRDYASRARKPDSSPSIAALPAWRDLPIEP